MSLGEHDRQIASLVMFGVIAELDEAGALVRVDCDGLLTDWIPWTATRAGPGARTWSAPEVGEQVVVLSRCGDPAQGVVLGSLYQDDHAAPADRKTLHRVQFADGTVIDYDRDSHEYKIDVGTGKLVINCATAEVHATESATLDTPTTHATGDLKVDGKIEAGGDITTPAEVKAGDIGLKAHHHTAQGATAPTTPSQA